MRINKPKWIILHHEAASNGFRSVNKWHRDNPQIWLGHYSSLGFAIGYHYYIDKTGVVHQGRINSEEGAHCVGMNLKSIGICLEGDFNNYLPTGLQEKALKNLGTDLMKKHNIPLSNVVPHRHFARRDCYGKLLTDDWGRKLMKKVLELQMAATWGNEEEIKQLMEKQITIMQMLHTIVIRIINRIIVVKGQNN